MRMFFRRLVSLFRTQEKPLPFGGVDVIARYAHGNVKLQCGRYLTAERYAEQKRRVLAYEF